MIAIFYLITLILLFIALVYELACGDREGCRLLQAYSLAVNSTSFLIAD